MGLKNILTGIGLILLILGQILIFSGNRLISGIVLTCLCFGIFFLVFTGKYMIFVVAFDALIKKLADYRKNSLIKAKVDRIMSKKTAKTDKVKPGIVAGIKKDNSHKAVFLELISKIGSEGINLSIPKAAFYILSGLLFILAQVFFFTGRLMPALVMLITSIIILALTLGNKEKEYKLHIDLGSGMKVLAMIAGLVLISIGWVMLLNRSINTQEWGVAFTIPGCILAYFGLPKRNPEVSDEVINREEILFLKPAILNNYFTKAVLLVLAFISLKVGYKIMMSPDYNMFSMIFYSAAIGLIFFALPVFGYSEKPGENKITDIIKLAFIILAMFIAYLAQRDYLLNKPNDAVLKYIVAAFIFILSFPVHKAKEKEPSEPFPIQLEIVFLVAIILVGVFLRVYEIDQRPFGLENDEAGGYTARLDRHGRVIQALSVGNFGIFVHIIQFFIMIFGELNRMSIKMLGVSVGLLSIPMIYFLIRYLLNPRAAIFATTIFTFLRWNLHYARSGHGYVMSNAVEILALYFMFKAIEKRNKFIWFVAGFCIGLSWHGIMTAFLLIIPVALYFIFSSFSQKHFLKSNAVGIFAFILGFWIFGSMIVHNYFISKNIYFARAQEVSVFSKDPNAPRNNPALGIVNNTRAVMEMFNKSGDSRQRNSGGNPYEPTIDFVSSMFFAVGLIYCVYYSRFYIFFIMVMVFFSQAAGSIFTIEAPSSMRAMGTMIPMIFFIAIVFDMLWRSLKNVLGKRFEILYFPLLLAIFLIPIIKDNYTQYFGRWMGGMDELSTATGLYTKKLGDKYRVVLYTMTYYPGHPPFKISRDTKVNSAGSLAVALRLLYQVEADENFALLFHYDTWKDAEKIRDIYFPGSKIEIVDHHYFYPKVKPGGGFTTFAKALLVSSEELKKRRGILAKYSFDKQPLENQLPVFKPENDGKIPYSVIWKGTFLARTYGRYKFFNKGTAKFNVSIDGVSVAPDAEVILADGFHDIKITSAKTKISDTLDLYYTGMGLRGTGVTSNETVSLGEKYLYNFKVLGLHGYYFNGKIWEENTKDMEIIDAYMWFNGGIHTPSTYFKGTLNVPESGEYVINAEYNGYLRIVIDGNKYWEACAYQPAMPMAEEYFRNKPMQKVQTFNLTKGKHEIMIYNIYSGIFHLLWNRIGQPNDTIPLEALEPDYNITQIK